jgi:hypothetical protein
MPGYDARHVVVGQEAGDALVVVAVLAHVVRLVLTHLELLPPGNPRFAHVGDRDAVGTTPALTHLAVGGYGQANDHRASPLGSASAGRVDRSIGDFAEVRTSEARALP